MKIKGNGRKMLLKVPPQTRPRPGSSDLVRRVWTSLDEFGRVWTRSGLGGDLSDLNPSRYALTKTKLQKTVKKDLSEKFAPLRTEMTIYMVLPMTC